MPQLLVLYHYFHPDDVVSAQHFAQFCLEMKQRGWEVRVMPCNRGCRDEKRAFPLHEVWEGIQIERVWRPAFRQASHVGRTLNLLWMLACWSGRALWRGNRADVLLIGTDPILSVLLALPWNVLQPKTKIVHWCFDLYPEGAVSEGLLKGKGIPILILRRVLRSAYCACDLIVDIGVCMKERLQAYGSPSPMSTLTPWALEEPEAPAEIDAQERALLFGDAKLGLLYSGSFGRAHSADLFLDLARMLRGESIRFAFSVRGNRVEQLQQSVTADDVNIFFAPFTTQERLLSRLGAADIHMASLRPEYTGVCVPSKFFGSLASGRPVLFEGSPDSAIARWIVEHGVGWVLRHGNLEQVAEHLKILAQSETERCSLRKRCYDVYQEFFSKRQVMNRFDENLRDLLKLS